MSSALPSCPDCGSTTIVKNGKIHNGKQNHKCKDCSRQFVEDPQHKLIDEQTKALIDKLLLEKIPLAGIARVVEGIRGLAPEYVNAKYANIEGRVTVSAQKKGDWQLSVMKPGHLWATRAISSGFGCRSIVTPVRLLGSTSVIAAEMGPERCGPLCLESIVSARCATATFGKPMRRCCLQILIERWAKRVGRPIILNDLTAPCGSEYRGWFARPYRSPKS